MHHSILDLPEDERPKVEARFWAKVEKTEGCWIWKGCTHGRIKYGAFNVTFSVNTAKMLPAHRVSYEITNGRISEGLTIDHLCRNPSCLNPEHLEAVTNRENALRGFGVGAINIRKTHCPRGHPLEGSNLSPRHLRKGWRTCLICIAEGKRRWDIRNAEHKRRYMKQYKEERKKS